MPLRLSFHILVVLLLALAPLLLASCGCSSTRCIGAIDVSISDTDGTVPEAFTATVHAFSPPLTIECPKISSVPDFRCEPEFGFVFLGIFSGESISFKIDTETQSSSYSDTVEVEYVDLESPDGCAECKGGALEISLE